MKKSIILLTVLMVLFSGMSFADTSEANYTELQFVQVEHAENGDITGLTVKDELRGLTLTFEYYDVLSMTADYVYSKYYYDYENDLLLIVGNDGTVWYDDTEY